jgi:hypothetical protein
MKFLKDSLKAPFPYFFNDEKKNALLSIGVCVFLMAFILTFNPKAIHHIDKTILIVVFTLVVLLPGITLAPRIFPIQFDPVSWTFGKHIAFSVFLLLIAGMVISVGLYSLNYYLQFSFVQTLLHIYPDAFIYGLIPITLVTLVAKNRMLKENLEEALVANREIDRIQVLKGQAQVDRTGNTINIQSDTSDVLSLSVADLLFIEADDNYCIFHWRSGAGVDKKMLRMNLKNVESQLNNNFTIRCHRSFIVNINEIDAIAGNTNGYKLSIAEGKYSIPVSRSKGKEIIQKIGHIRSVMELQ